MVKGEDCEGTESSAPVIYDDSVERQYAKDRRTKEVDGPSESLQNDPEQTPTSDHTAGLISRFYWHMHYMYTMPPPMITTAHCNSKTLLLNSTQTGAKKCKNVLPSSDRKALSGKEFEVADHSTPKESEFDTEADECSSALLIPDNNAACSKEFEIAGPSTNKEESKEFDTKVHDCSNSAPLTTNEKAARGEEFEVADPTSHKKELKDTKFGNEKVYNWNDTLPNGKLASVGKFEVAAVELSTCTTDLEVLESKVDTDRRNIVLLLDNKRVAGSTDSQELKFDHYYSSTQLLPDSKILHDEVKAESEIDMVDPVEETHIYHYDSFCCGYISHDCFRGDRLPYQPDFFEPPKGQQYSWNVKTFNNNYDGVNHNETTVASSSGYYTGNSNYSNDSYRAKIVVGNSKRDSLGSTYDQHGTNLCGVYSESDNAHKRSVNHKQRLTDNDLQKQTKHSDLFCKAPQSNNNAASFRYPHAKGIAHDQLKVPETLCDIYSETDKADNKRHSNHHEHKAACSHESYRQTKDIHEVTPKKTNAKKQASQGIVNDAHIYSETSTAAKPFGYNKLTYPVLVGNVVRVYSTELFASLPNHDKVMVKERQKDSTGNVRVKLALKSSTRLVEPCCWLLAIFM